MFPFTTESFDNGYYIVKPWHDNATFLKYKPKGLVWYAYDVEILSLTRAKFIVYDMADFCSGGIGDVKSEYECDIDPVDAVRLVQRQARKLAKQMEEEEFNLRRSMRRQEIEDELLSAAGIKS